LTAWRFCYDSGAAAVESEFRKPKPGMLLRAAHDLNIDLAQSWMVGDRWRVLMRVRGRLQNGFD